METVRTQVVIVGAGPAGLLLGHQLNRHGVDTVIVERRSLEYVEQRVRAGVLEYGVVEYMDEAGVAGRLRREGLQHHGIELRFDRTSHRIALSDLYEGKAITVYGQQEVVKDLIAARRASGAPLHFESEVTSVTGLTGDRPTVTVERAEGPLRVEADYVVGADGGHGVSALAAPEGHFRRFERVYPFSWLGILAEAAPPNDELIYCRHERGFALYSMRSPTVSRLYLGVRPEDTLEMWPDDRIWEELALRLATEEAVHLNVGPIFERSVTAMRSVVVAPMRYGRLLLAGDAAHIVPPTGAKGLNLAVGDVSRLVPALVAQLHEGDARLLDAYSDTCLERVWRGEEFSTYMTQMLHPHFSDEFENGVQRARLRQVVASEPAARHLARNYVNLSFL